MCLIGFPWFPLLFCHVLMFFPTWPGTQPKGLRPRDPCGAWDCLRCFLPGLSMPVRPDMIERLGDLMALLGPRLEVNVSRLFSLLCRDVVR